MLLFDFFGLYDLRSCLCVLLARNFFDFAWSISVFSLKDHFESTTCASVSAFGFVDCTRPVGPNSIVTDSFN